MRKVTFGGANSLDNFIAREDGGVDWLLWSNDAGQIMQKFWTNVDCIVMGRKTYDISKAMDPTGEKVKSIHGSIKTYVFSRTLKPGERDGVEIVAEDAGKFVKKLKKQKGKEICVMGGGELGTALLEAGVVDEIGFNIHPVLLGSGVPLFHKMKKQIDLELIEARPIQKDCVYVLYRVKN
jgi:dihydrofolate reductase